MGCALFRRKSSLYILVMGGRDAGVRVTYYELDSMFGHDTFLIDIPAVGSAVKGHLEH